MPRKKKPFDKRNAQKFSLVPRSLQDPALHTGGSEYVLMPVPTRHNPDAGGAAAMEFAMAAGMADGRGEGEGGEGARDSDTPAARHANDEVDEWGFPVDGYDYSQHFKPMGTGVFVSASGKVMAAKDAALGKKKAAAMPTVAEDGGGEAGEGVEESKEPASRGFQLPKEVMPSEELADRMLEGITLNPARLPEEIRAALEGDGEFEELQDDFVVQANDPDAEDDTFASGAFDLDAHLAKLLADAEAEDAQTAAAAGRAKREAAKDAATKAAVRFEDDDEYDEITSDEEDESERAPARDETTEAGKALAEHLKAVLGHYEEEEIGELDPEDPRVQGSGFQEAMFESAMNEFLELSASIPVARVMEEKAAEEQEEAVGGTGAGAGAPASGTSDGTPAAAAASASASGDRIVPYGFAEEDDNTLPLEEDPTVQMPQPASRPQWDAQTIISTYSTSSNHPSVIDDGPDPRRKRKGKGKGRRAAAPAAAEEAAMVLASGDMAYIPLSAKTGLPVGVAVSAAARKKAAAGDAIAESEEESDEEEEDAPDAFDEAPEIDVAALSQRTKGESAEERRSRKAAVKAARKAKREQKKNLKTAFKVEEHRQAELRKTGTGGNSVFKL